MKKSLYSDWTAAQRKDCMQIGEKIDKETLYHFRENAGNQNDFMIQMSEVADIVGGLPIYDTIIKPDPYAPWEYAGQCYAGKAINHNAALSPMIYVCSAYRADTQAEHIRNVAVAKYVCRRIANKGCIPIAPHLYFPRFMNDGIDANRSFGMGAGKRLAEYCDGFHVVTIDGRISEGMKEEIEYMTGILLLNGITTNYTAAQAQQIMADGLET